MSGVGEAFGAVGFTFNVINVACIINKKLNKKLNPSKILKYAERKINNFDKEVMMEKLIELDPESAEKAQETRIRAETAIEDAKAQGNNFRKIKVRLLACRAAYALCENYEAEIRDLSATALKRYNDAQIKLKNEQRAAAAKRQYDAGLPVVGRKSLNSTELSDPKFNSQDLFTCQICPSCSYAKFDTSMEENGESGCSGNLLLVRVTDEMMESVQRGEVIMVADVSRQQGNDQSTNIVAPVVDHVKCSCPPSPERPSSNVSESSGTIPISIQSSNDIAFDPDLLMTKICDRFAG